MRNSCWGVLAVPGCCYESPGGWRNSPAHRLTGTGGFLLQLSTWAERAGDPEPGRGQSLPGPLSPVLSMKGELATTGSVFIFGFVNRITLKGAPGSAPAGDLPRSDSEAAFARWVAACDHLESPKKPRCLALTPKDYDIIDLE